MKSLPMRSFTAILFGLVFGVQLIAEDLDASLAKLADGLVGSAAKSSVKKVSVLDFTDLQGNTTELGRYLAEQLSVRMVSRAMGSGRVLLIIA